jgi:hypothetical protein
VRRTIKISLGSFSHFSFVRAIQPIFSFDSFSLVCFDWGEGYPISPLKLGLRKFCLTVYNQLDTLCLSSFTFLRKLLFNQNKFLFFPFLWSFNGAFFAPNPPLSSPLHRCPFPTGPSLSPWSCTRSISLSLVLPLKTKANTHF